MVVGGITALADEKPTAANERPVTKTTRDERNAHRLAECCFVRRVTEYKLVNRQAANESATLEYWVSLFHPRSNGFGGVFGSEVHRLRDTFVVKCFFKRDIH